MADRSDETLITLTADIVAAHVSNNSVAVSDLPLLIGNIHGALAGLGAADAPQEELVPAVSVRASVKPDYIVCLEDGKKLKMLKRHLMTHYNLTPGDYRAKWNLPHDYPMVAPNYAEQRRALAVQIGLGASPRRRRRSAQAGRHRRARAGISRRSERKSRPRSSTGSGAAEPLSKNKSAVLEAPKTAR